MELGEYIRMALDGCDIRAGDLDVIDVQPRETHVEGGCAEGRDVVLEGDDIIGCGAIGPFWGKEDESSLFTIFVDPDKQGKGIGRHIMNTLESDEFFLRAKRIEIPASITGVPFYLKMGYFLVAIRW